MFTTSGTLDPFDACAEWDDSIADDVVYSDLDTYNGQSGSAVWSLDSDGKRIVRAIHIAGPAAGDTETGMARERTVASWLFEEVKKTIEANSGTA